MPQFSGLFHSLVSCAPCLAIDMPGCGLSSFDPKSYEAYTMEALVALYKVVIEKYAEIDRAQEVVLVGHSLGCSIAALLASNTSTSLHKLQIPVAGILAICPASGPPTQKETARNKWLLALPEPMLEMLRRFDRRGGINSTSVTRFVGKEADVDLKKQQLRYNSQFPTAVLKRIGAGILPSFDASGKAFGGIPGREVWAGIDVPLAIIAGEADAIAKVEEVAKIVEYLKTEPRASTTEKNESDVIPQTANGTIHSSEPKPQADETQFGLQPSSIEATTKHARVLKTAILPSPASHAVLYDHATYRTVAGLIEDFLVRHVNERLGLGWQLQHLNSSGKWDVKNLEKWRKVAPVSEPIDSGFFRALKTLREQDDVHCPSVFTRTWSGRIFAVIDISKDMPTYDPKLINEGGIQYHKFPTVSKIPPTVPEVNDFVALVDRLRKEIKEQFGEETTDQPFPSIGVHCHYGYNRTGFFICSYLIEKRGWKVQDAIDEFKSKRPPGIRHDHFIDALWARYCIGLKRAPTIRTESERKRRESFGSDYDMAPTTY